MVFHPSILPPLLLAWLTAAWIVNDLRHPSLDVRALLDWWRLKINQTGLANNRHSADGSVQVCRLELT
jgi:hypothetical protein